MTQEKWSAATGNVKSMPWQIWNHSYVCGFMLFRSLPPSKVLGGFFFVCLVGGFYLFIYFACTQIQKAELYTAFLLFTGDFVPITTHKSKC